MAIIALAVHSTTRISGLAAGSGIPDMKSLLSGYDLREHVSFRTGAAKVWSGAALLTRMTTQ
eukprot:SAG31_NODE_605_length_13628_cov_24.848030_2_plen_62_part_00